MAKGTYGHMNGITPAAKKCSMAFFCMSCPFSPKKVLLCFAPAHNLPFVFSACYAVWSYIFSGLSCCFAVRALLRHRVKARPLLCAFVFFGTVPRVGLCSVTAIKPMAGPFVLLESFPGRFKRKGWTNATEASPIPVNHSKAPSFSESRSRKNPAFLLRKVRQLRVEKVTLESPPGIKTDGCGRACVCRSAPRAMYRSVPVGR